MDIRISAIYKAINSVSKKVNSVEKKLDDILHALHKEDAENIATNATGIDDMATVTSDHESAIEDLATIISEMEEN